MMTIIILVLIVLALLLFIQGRSSHTKINESLSLTKEIHKEVVANRKVAGEVVDKHVAINKEEGVKLADTINSSKSE